MGVQIGEQATTKRSDSALGAGNPGNEVGDGTAAAARRRAWFTEGWEPTRREDAYRVSRIEGEVPREIHGTLYRNGPSQRILPKAGYQALHLFDGDGLVHGFRIDDGDVDYRGRFVENDCARFEQSEGVFSLDGFQTRADVRTDKFLYRVQPNTNVVFHGNKLMALVENAFPFEMDPRTLASIGENDFGGKRIGMSVSAHPKIDGKTGQMVIHGYQPFEPYVQLYVVEPDGTCSLAENIDAPFPGMMHDMAITENYVVFILPPAVIDGQALMSGEKPFQETMTWEPERGLLFGVRRREAGSPVRWLRAPSVGFIFHPGNAYEKDGKIVLDACTYLNGEKLLLKTLPKWRSGSEFGDGAWQARPFLYEIDLDAGTVRERQLDDRGAEFPRLDDRLVGYENRYGYAVRMPKDAGGNDEPWNVITKYDRRGGPSAVHEFGEGQFPGEPVFVPRSADAAEDDGFVLTTVYDGPQARSYLAILDARDMAGVPLAKCHLEHSIPMGFHGNFAAGVV